MAERDEGYVRIGADLRETMAFFEGLDVNKKAIQKKILKTVGIGARQAVKTNFTKVLHKRTGKLVKSVLPDSSRLGVYHRKIRRIYNAT